MASPRGIRRFTVCLATLVLLLAASPRPYAAQDPEAPGLERVKIGMTAAEAQRTLGPPARIVRQILYRRQLVQWTYEGKSPFWIEIEHLKGQDPRVRAVHRLSAAKP